MTLTDSGPTGFPSFPDDPDTVLYEQVLHAAARTGNCPAWLGPTPLQVLVGTRSWHFWWD